MPDHGNPEMPNEDLVDDSQEQFAEDERESEAPTTADDETDALVDEEGQESFPTSDPPSNY